MPFLLPLQLLDTKTPDKQTTLLHFLVETVEEKFPDLVNFYDELDGITAASRGEFIDREE
nr:Formin proteiny 2 domain containing protein [Hymenolepis microstoma]